jgi:hypothetical protein
MEKFWPFAAVVTAVPRERGEQDPPQHALFITNVNILCYFGPKSGINVIAEGPRV